MNLCFALVLMSKVLHMCIRCRWVDVNSGEMSRCIQGINLVHLYQASGTGSSEQTL